jgi:hypothetical protein
LLSADLSSLRFVACTSHFVADCCSLPPPVIDSGCCKGLGKDGSTVDNTVVGGCGTVTTKIVHLSDLQVVSDVVQNGLRTSRHCKDLQAKMEHPFVGV